MFQQNLQKLKLLSQENSTNRFIVDGVYHKIGGDGAGDRGGWLTRLILYIKIKTKLKTDGIKSLRLNSW